MRILLRRFLAAGLLGLAATASFACSLIIEHRDRQCEKDGDCAAFKNAQCDVGKGVCVERAGTGCNDPSGCYACEPKSTKEFETACTDAGCIKYDNTPLKALLEPDGGLPPVP